MNKVNWSKYKFHCSSLPVLMTKSRSKKEILSETTKAKLREIWIEEVYGRKNYGSANKYTQKGLEVEQDSLEIVTKVLNKGFLAKNKETLENEYLIGTPDVVSPILIDIKSSYDIWTFSAIEEKKAIKDYYWQLLGYMWMLGITESKLIYALVNTPPMILEDEIYRLTFKIGEEEADKARINYQYDDINVADRVKIFDLGFDESRINEVMIMCHTAREYLAKIKL